MAKKIQKFKNLQGVEYKILDLPPNKRKKFDGLCDDPSIPKPKIYLNPDLNNEVMVETIIHECLHAFGFNELSEKLVTKYAKTVTKLLKQKDLIP